MFLICAFVSSIILPSNTYSNEYVEEIQFPRTTLWRTVGNYPNIYYNSAACGHLSEFVLSNIAQDIEAGVINAEKMQKDTYSKQVLDDECLRLKQEEIYRTTDISK